MIVRKIAPESGFTLIELLVVISIIALLIALLLPALSTARSAAQSVGCLANLSQLAIGMANYGADNNTYYVTGNHDLNYLVNWHRDPLTPYIGALTLALNNIRVCPGDPAPWAGTTMAFDSNHPSYGYNGWIAGTGLGSFGNRLNGHRETNIQFSTKKIMFADKAHRVETGAPTTSGGAVLNGNSLTGPTPWPRHHAATSANILWVDGHATNENRVLQRFDNNVTFSNNVSYTYNINPANYGL